MDIYWTELVFSGGVEYQRKLDLERVSTIIYLHISNSDLLSTLHRGPRLVMLQYLSNPDRSHPLNGHQLLIRNIHGSQNGHGTSRFQTLFHRVRSFKDLVQLLEGTILRLGEEEIDEGNLDEIPEDEDEVEVVTNLLESRPGAVCENDRDARGDEIAKSGPLARVEVVRVSATYILC